ncbi:MAG: hypothetical protein WCI74_22055, partial [Actinomycetes bacterium]
MYAEVTSKVTRVAAIMAVVVLPLAACGSQSATVREADPTSAGNSGSAAYCDWFNQSDLPTPPSPAPTPYGPPTDPASLTATQNAVIQAAKALPQTGQYCATGQTGQGVGPISTAPCSSLYWGFQYSHLPNALTMPCKFWYVRADNRYWTQITPLVLNEYASSLGLIPDGQDPANLQAGPHVTLTSVDGTPVGWGSIQAGSAPFAAYATLPSANGVLDPVATTALVTKLATATDATVNASAMPQPILGGATMKADCTKVWTVNASATVPLSSVTPTAGQSIWCEMVGDQSIGTAYAQLQFGTPTAGGVPVAAVINEPGPISAIPHKVPGSSKPADLVVPINTDEVKSFKTTPVTIPSTCSNEPSSRASQAQCLSLWVNNNGSTTGGCSLWFVLQVDKTEMAATLERYGISAAGFTAHVSIAKNKKATAAQCTAAKALNAGVGRAA